MEQGLFREVGSHEGNPKWEQGTSRFHSIYKREADLRSEFAREIYPVLAQSFIEWLIKYSDVKRRDKKGSRYQNEILYNLENRKDYVQAIIDYISGMSDNFAIKIFNEITTF